MPTGTIPPPRLSIALASASALACEVLLTRLFTIIQWHHFAFMAISLALLGYGASGTFLALAAPRLLVRFRLAYAGNLALFGLSSLACFLLAQEIPFNAQELLWDPRQTLLLAGTYLTLSLPFFFVANAIGLALIRFQHTISAIYAADLLGAGLGAVLILGLLSAIFPHRALQIIAMTGMASAAVASLELRSSHLRVGFFALISLIPLLLPSAWLALHPTPFKDLPQTLAVSGTRILHESAGPIGVLTVVDSPTIPLRYAPGLSLITRNEPPPQLAVFTDGTGMTVVNQVPDPNRPPAYLDELTSAAPYHVQPMEHVLVLGAGGGSDVLQALLGNAAKVTAVEVNRQLIGLVQDRYAAFAGRLYEHPRVEVIADDARGFLSRQTGDYDLILLTLVGAFTPASAGLHALSEDYLYTVEALETYLDHLRPDGILAITRWLDLPPRDSLKLLNTAAAALELHGISSPGDHLFLLRNWQTITLLVRARPWDSEAVASLKSFCETRLFDLVYYSGMPAMEANRHNRLPHPAFYEAALALLGADAGRFQADYKFNLRPATDDRPFFFHFLKWRSLPELLNLLDRGGMSLVDVGYLVLWAALLQAGVFSGLFILLPLLLRRKTLANRNSARSMAARPLAYFFLLGLAFLLMEIAWMQKCILYLHHPVYSVASILAAFLLFAGLGSSACQRLQEQNRQRTGIIGAIILLLLLGLLYVWQVDALFRATMDWPLFWKIMVCLLLIAPMAYAMGHPFPLGLSLLADSAPNLLPWAWGVNGCASVISAILAALLAIHLGYATVIQLALTLYAGAALLTPAQGQTDRITVSPGIR